MLVAMSDLTGAVCTLRALADRDVERLVEIQAQPSVARWWGEPDRSHLKGKVRPAENRGSFGIEVGGELAGLIEYEEETSPEFRRAGIDLFLAAPYQGRGIGGDAVRTLVRYLFVQRGHHRITIDPIVENTAAVRAYEKVGFRPVGVMREYWRCPEGRWCDGLLMELLARDHQER